MTGNPCHPIADSARLRGRIGLNRDRKYSNMLDISDQGDERGTTSMTAGTSWPATAVAAAAPRVPVLARDEAVRSAGLIADALAVDAGRRDAQRVLPAAELESLTASGLLAITVPGEYGGADLPAETVAEVFPAAGHR